MKDIYSINNLIPRIITYSLVIVTWLTAQTHIPADPYYLLFAEKDQFDGQLPMQSNLFRPVFFNTDSLSFSFTLRSEGYFNDNTPNQENMDVRYFSKGSGNFNSVQIAFNSNYFSFMVEPYLTLNKFSPVKSVSNRRGVFNVLNDRPLYNSQKSSDSGFRNILAFIHYK